MLQGRKKCVTVFEIIFPLTFAALLLLIRALSKSEYIDHNTQYAKFSLNTVVFGQGNKILYSPSNPYTDALMTTLNSVYIAAAGKNTTLFSVCPHSNILIQIFYLFCLQKKKKKKT